jgi:hypothetical protein
MTRRLGATFAMVLAFAVASATQAATAASTSPVAQAQPIGELQELDEIWVRGKSLSDQIVDTEDEFFRLYNKLNRNHDFDVQCGYLRLDRDSLAMSRTCVPQYLAYGSYYPDTFWNVNMGSSCSGSSYSQTIGQDLNSSDYWYMASCGQPRYSTMSDWPTRIYVGLSPERIAERRQEYVRSLIRAIYADQRLLEKANELTGLYQEMRATQDQYNKVKAEDKAQAEAERRERREKRRE